MEHLDITIEKLKGFGQLPQPEYAAMARIVIEDLKKVQSQWAAWREEYEIKMGGKFMQNLVDICESGTTRTFEYIGGFDFTVSVTKIKSKK